MHGKGQDQLSFCDFLFFFYLAMVLYRQYHTNIFPAERVKAAFTFVIFVVFKQFVTSDRFVILRAKRCLLSCVLNVTFKKNFPWRRMTLKFFVVNFFFLLFFSGIPVKGKRAFPLISWDECQQVPGQQLRVLRVCPLWNLNHTRDVDDPHPSDRMR